MGLFQPTFLRLTCFGKILSCCLLMFMSNQALGVVFVDKNSPAGAPDGTSWSNAYTTIQAGINKAKIAGDSVWVADGTYPESITLDDDVQLYGGFASGETALKARDIKTNKAIIDGTGTQKHVVIMEDLTNVRLDGFTIKGGNANGSSTGATAATQLNVGAGIYARNLDNSTMITSCTVVNNHAPGVSGSTGLGGGIALISSSPMIMDCQILDNSAFLNFGGFFTFGNGGGVYMDNSSPLIDRCIIAGNISGNFGAGLHIGTAASVSSPTMIHNSKIFDNSSDTVGSPSQGGGIFTLNSALVLLEVENTIISGNFASIGGGAYCNIQSQSSFKNCVFSENTSANRWRSPLLYNIFSSYCELHAC